MEELAFNMIYAMITPLYLFLHVLLPVLPGCGWQHALLIGDVEPML